jgi:hypothetical protein
MRPARALSVPAAAALFTLPAVALAPDTAPAETDSRANLNLLLVSADPAFCAGPYEPIDEGSCPDLVSVPRSGPAFLWVVASRQGGFSGFPVGSIGAVQFGIEYDAGVAVDAWHLCTGGVESPSPSWPGSGSGNAITWSRGCHTPPGTSARVGFFVLADAAARGAIGLTPDARTGSALWMDCGSPPLVSPVEFTLCYASQPSWPRGNLGGITDLSRGSMPVCGDNCTNPTTQTSWGVIKSLY